MIGHRPSLAAVRPARFAPLGPAVVLSLTLLATALPASAAKAAPPANRQGTPAASDSTGAAVRATPEQELRSLDASRFATMVAGDTAALKNLLGEDLTYTHSTGVVQDRVHFLDALSSGSLRYESIAPSDVLVRLYGPAGVVTGRVDMKVVLDGNEKTIAARYTAVYVRRDLRWQLVAWQSSPLPAQ